MLVFFFIISLVFILNVILYFSSIRFEVKTFKIDTINKPKITDYKIVIYLAFLNKIKYLKIDIYKEKIDRINDLKLNKIKERILNLKIIKKMKGNNLINATIKLSKAIRNTNIQLEKIDIKAAIGYSNIVILSNLVAAIDIIISILLARKQRDKSFKINSIQEKYKYVITPKQTNNIYIKTNINVIFSLKISNIVKKSCNLKKIKV